MNCSISELRIAAIAALMTAVFGCGQELQTESKKGQPEAVEETVVFPVEELPVEKLPKPERQPARTDMVNSQMRARGITNERVLSAVEKVPRHEYVPEHLIDSAYDDSPLPIGYGQTISQPYIVALMTELADPKQSEKALDVGTGSGYQAAILAELVDHVYTIEIVESLGKQAATRLADLGYENITTRIGDGFVGWPDEAPFDVIILAAAPENVPPPLIEQLAVGGRLVLPVGTSQSQELLLITRVSESKIIEKRVAAVAFVPMTGKAQQKAP